MDQVNQPSNKWGYLLLFLFFAAFIYGDLFPTSVIASIAPSLLDVNTIFLSIVLEAIPFILLVVFYNLLDNKKKE
ncbi:hypothetical protein [Halobacillus sp. Marseille-Q1614]|uniref:hypothetical protein n=1 Tax=Halobacillus sp. Marseille-Q1614 TaxID=2709134 RepID=UPI0020C1E7FD|nr:hypothetical protein [Halobacillus sp. Marseille-Q1614]